jgi:hypothetical protein
LHEELSWLFLGSKESWHLGLGRRCLACLVVAKMQCVLLGQVCLDWCHGDKWQVVRALAIARDVAVCVLELNKHDNVFGLVANWEDDVDT